MKIVTKRLVSIVLTIFILMTLSSFSAIAIEENGDLCIYVAQKMGFPGETVDVEISIRNNPGLGSLKFDVEYGDYLTLENVSFDSAFGMLVTAPTPYTNPQTLSCISPTQEITTEGVFATLTFAIAEDAPNNYTSEIKITYEPNGICDGDLVNINTTVENGKVTICHRKPGDTNNDDLVDNKDAILVFRHSAGWDVDLTDEDKEWMDVNADFYKDNKDAILIFRASAGWDVKLLPPPVKHVHSLTTIPAKEATATENGNIAYWYCATCNKYFNDSECSNEITLEDTVIKYTACKVVFQDYDGTVLSTQYIEAGGSATAPNNPTRTGYEFTGWDRTFENITSDTVITAKYVAVEAPTFVVDSVTAEAGETGVEVSISLENNPGVASILFNIEYDEKKFTLTDLVYNDELGGDCIGLEPDVATDSPACAYWSMHINDMTKDIVFVTLTFDVAADTAPGEYPITILYDTENVYNKNEENVHFEIVNGKIIVD